jgi:8-oxo-dGTP pyrophosphatase MutT (NUDIX family)
MAGEDGAPAPEDPERRTRRRRSPRATTTDGAGAKGRAEPSSKRTGAAASAGGTLDASERTDGGRKSSGARSRKQARRKQPKKTPAKKPSGKKQRPARRRDEDRRLPTQREVSAGGVVYRRGDDGIEVVLASRRTRRGDLAWGLAKGGIERGESREDAAIREVREETGLDAEIEADLGDTRYIYVWEDVRIRKRVHFFLMRHTGGDVDDRDDEMEEVRWFPLERARKRAAYRGERDVLARAAELLT